MSMKRALFAAGSLVAACVLSGCYHHVVSARGAPPGKYDVYEPNLSDDGSTPTPVTPGPKEIPTPTVPSKVVAPD